jgi:hypothetical protein
MRFTKRLPSILAALPVTLVLNACGSSGPTVRPADTDDSVQNVLNAMESTLAIISKAKDVDDAVAQLQAYCGPLEGKMDEWRAEIEADEARMQRLEKGMMKMTDQFEDSMDPERAGWMGLDAIGEAAANCRGQ